MMSESISTTLAAFHDRREELKKEFLTTMDVDSYLARNTALLRETLCQYASEYKLSHTWALVAQGGFARGELYPYSDIDLLLLLPEAPSKDEEALLSAFLTHLWDLGLNVGANVRTQSEMLDTVTSDITITTTFFESNFLWGNATLYHETYVRFRKTFNEKDFFKEKLLELQERHRKHGDTPYELEPNVKESPGALRDLQTLRWCALAAGFGRSWDEFVTSELLTSEECDELKQSEKELSRIRVCLHFITNRPENRLIFEIQEQLAQLVGFKAKRKNKASETFMRRYYTIAKTVNEMTDVFMRVLQSQLLAKSESEETEILDEDFARVGDEIVARHDESFIEASSKLLTLFYHFGRRRDIKKISTELSRRIWRERRELERTSDAFDQVREELLEILKLDYGAYDTLNEINRFGLFGVFMPDFAHIVAQPQHDLFHVYTVDQHTLRVVKYLGRFARSSYAHEFPLCTDIMTTMKRPWRMTVAGLFHDVGKGLGSPHAIVGEGIFWKYAYQWGLNRDDAEFIAFLIREHLTMSQVAQKEDTTDIDVVRRFASVVKTRERLDALYLITVADIRATGPKIWTTWKAQLLEDLYHSTLQLLENKSDTFTRQSISEKRQALALQLLPETLSREATLAFWHTLDVAYFMRHTPEDLLWHAQAVLGKPEDMTPLVDVQKATERSFNVLVYAPDMKDFFVRLVRAFEVAGLSIVQARIHTTKKQWALDTFLVEDKRDRENAADVQHSTVQAITRALSHNFVLEKPVTGRLSRRSRSFPVPTIVKLERDASRKSWILQITCADRVGLLYAIAWALSKNGINLMSSKIATFGERAEDIFLIESPHLDDSDAVIQLKSDLIDAIDGKK